MTYGLALCAGVGGLELGLGLALGDSYRTVCHVERDAYAAATLVARMADEALGEAPIWDDLFTFDPRPWRGKVDLVTAGFPCQPFSVAGKQRAEEDERHLFPRIAEIIRDVGPRLVFLENVRGLLTASGGRVFGDVLGTLADLGFDSEWLCLRASAVGAPHRRERVFILAHAHDCGDFGLQREGELREFGGEHRGHPDGHDLAGIPPFPPGPEDRDAWARILAERPDLAPALADAGGERLQGFVPTGAAEGATGRSDGAEVGGGQGEVKSELCGMDDGLAGWLDYRQDRLRCAGNGVVALQAAAAFSVLARRRGVGGWAHG